MAQIPRKQRKLVKSNMYTPSDKWNELIKAELTSMGAEYQKLYELRCIKRMRDITENIWAAARENELLNTQ